MVEITYQGLSYIDEYTDTIRLIAHSLPVCFVSPNIWFIYSEMSSTKSIGWTKHQSQHLKSNWVKGAQKAIKHSVTLDQELGSSHAMNCSKAASELYLCHYYTQTV